MNTKFLLHTCCAPCGVAVIEELKKQYDLTVYFYNPNIHPIAEYQKRKDEIIRICDKYGIVIIDADYEVENWGKAVCGFESEPEGGARCVKCFELRLGKTAQYAKENGFDIFCTTLTSGRNKKATIINSIGLVLENKYGVKFFEADWKKGGRQEKARRIIKEKSIYQQKYCGCIYSFK